MKNVRTSNSFRENRRSPMTRLTIPSHLTPSTNQPTIPNRRSPMHRFALLLVLLSAIPVTAGDAINRVNDLYVDPPTLECLGFRWYINGDDDGDATGELTFRPAGEETWRQALPMLRVNREVVNYDFRPYACENLLAGSILDLDPGVEYEVRCVLSDPDGGGADTTLTVRTREVPEYPAPKRILHVYQPGHPEARKPRVYTSLHKALRYLQPGDEVRVHAGVHFTNSDTLRIDISGTPEAPIVIRPAGDGKAFIDGGSTGIIFDIRDTEHLFFEDLTVRTGDTAFRADGASHLTIRRCQILDVRTGLYSYSEHSTHWYIADNTITGRNENWYPRGQDNPSHTGINLYGRGHVVTHNRISDFWDGIAIANYGKPPHDLALQAVAIDFSYNDLSEFVDDGVETDYGCHNVRVWGNRIRNAHTGLSAQPTYGGPIYLIRNQVYNATSLSLKLHNWCTGLEIYHNTLISARQGFRSYPRWQNTIMRNNLILGVSRYAVETGSPDPRTTLDYDGYHRTDDPEDRFFKWIVGEDSTRYATLEEFTAATGLEEHGIEIGYDIFNDAQPPEEGKTYPTLDLLLDPESPAVDAGMALPTINDTHQGDAPDLGCCEAGEPLPRYGPREE